MQEQNMKTYREHGRSWIHRFHGGFPILVLIQNYYVPLHDFCMTGE